MSIEAFLDNTMNERQISAVRESPPQHVFAVVSWGRTATAWLAKALNSHPEIFSVHAGNGTLAELSNAPRMSGLPYLRVLGVMGYAYKAAGDVHGIPKSEIAFLKKKLGDQFGSAIIVRDPVARFKSYVAFHEHFDFAMGNDLAFLDQHISFNGNSAGTLTNRQRVEIQAARLLNEILEEEKISKIYRSEDLTQKPESLIDLVREISNGKITATREWAEMAIAIPVVNDMPRKKSAEAANEEWIQTILKGAVLKSAWDAYANLGYAVPDFIK